MKLLIVTTIIVVASAAQLSSSHYLPPTQGGSVEQGSNLGEGIFWNVGNRRPQQVAEKYAAILEQSQEMDERSFRYSFETSNAIRAEEADDATQRRGSFAYTGDDGNLYSITQPQA